MAIIKNRGILVDIMLDISPDSYGPYITTDRNRIRQLINQCMNAIYGTMVASLFYYCKFFKTLKPNNFKMNPYDPCVAKRLVNILQQLILFHVDVFKLSYKYTKVNYIFIEVIRK